MALPRDSFLAPDFHAPRYLATLTGRHQTLEDLRSDLRERSNLISDEMHELVNANWTEFLSLGVGLRGGEEKIEGVRVAVLGFRRTLEEAQTSVKVRRSETDLLCRQLREIVAARLMARSMLELGDRITLLELQLGVVSLSALSGPAGETKDEEDWFFDTDSEDDDNKDGSEDRWISTAPKKLTIMAIELARLDVLVENLGTDIPLVKKLAERMAKCRKSLLRDLWSGLKEAQQAGDRGRLRAMDYLGIYNILGAEAEAVVKLKSQSTK